MKKNPLIYFLSLFSILMGNIVTAQIYSENFNDPASLNTNYTIEDQTGTTFGFSFNNAIPSGADYLTNQVPGDVSFVETQPTNHDGSRAILLEDLDGINFPLGGISIVSKSIDISNYTNLEIGLKVSSFNSLATRYEVDDRLDVQYQLNGSGSWITVGSFWGNKDALPTAQPYLWEDTDLNGTLDVQTGPDFRSVLYDLDSRAGSAVTGSSIKVRVLINSYGPQEEMGFDDLVLTGTLSAPDVVVSLSKSDVSCSGGSNGSITATVSSGTPNYTYSWSNGSVTSNTTSLSNSITNLTAGTYTVTVTDNNGKTDIESITVGTVLDVTDPTINSIASQTVNVNGNCVGTLPDYTGLAVVSDNCDVSPTVTQSPVAGTALSTSTLVTLTVTDASGNSSNTSFDVTLQDVTDPTIATVASQTVNVDGNCVGTLGDYTGLAVVSDNCDASPTVTQSPVAGTALSTSTLVTLTVTDASGNSSNTSFDVILQDVTDPTIATVASQTVNADGNCVGTLGDYTGLAVVSDNCDASPTVTQSPVAGTALSTSTLVTLTVTDASGNSSNTSFDVILQDVTDPTIATVASQTVNADGNCVGTLGDYTGLAVVSDNCDASPTVTQSPVAGTALSTSTLVTLTVTDASGNSSNTSFDVTLQDVTDPTIATIASQTVNVNGNCVGTLGDYTGLAVVSDNCDASPTVTQSPVAGTALSTSTLVTLTVTDASGNSSNTSFDVTLQDVTDPTIATVAPQIVNVDVNCSASLPDYTGLAVVSDNCDASPTVTQSPVAGTLLGDLITVVTLTVTDASGNSSSTSFNVNAVDEIDPLIVCPNDTIISSDLALVVTYNDPVATDNCMIANTELLTGLGSGETFPIGVTTETFRTTDLAGNTDECTFTVTVDEITGLFDNETVNKLFYPNPTDGLLFIQNEELTNVSIRNLNGVEVLYSKDHKTELDLNGLPSGSYIIQFEIQSEVYYQKVLLN